MARNKYPEQTRNLIVDQALKLFTQKGYDATSIQDIIDTLGGLSKGAIYHHFKSKDEIFEAVGRKIGNLNTAYYDKIRDDAGRNGLQKLKLVFKSAYQNPTNDMMLAVMDKIFSDAKFLANQIHEIYEVIAPCYVLPIIEQGIADGSIQTDYPKELAEVIITLVNIWINPVISKSTPAQMHSKLLFLSALLRSLGADVFDEEMIAQYVALGERYRKCVK